MSLDVSTLTAYTDQEKLELITKTLFTPKTASLMTLQTGIKSKAAINKIDTDATFQAGSACGWTASGSTSLTQRDITVGAVAIMEALCMKTLEGYYTQHMLKAGSRQDEVPFEEAYTGVKIGKIGEQLETAIWQGDTASGSANLNKFDGLLKLIDAAAGVVDGNPGGITVATGIVAANIRTILESFYGVIPASCIDKDDWITFIGWDKFRTLIVKLTTDNLFHYKTDEGAQSGVLYYPGTGMRIEATHGLTGTNRIIGARASNLYFGTDLEREEEQFRIWYSEDNRETRFLAEFKAGVQVAHPDEVVEFTLVP